MYESERAYGFELIMDLHGCDVSKFTRKSIKKYMIAVCEAIDMEREDLHFWDYEGIPVKEAVERGASFRDVCGTIYYY